MSVKANVQSAISPSDAVQPVLTSSLELIERTVLLVAPLLILNEVRGQSKVWVT
jgi:hypothetical protein